MPNPQPRATRCKTQTCPKTIVESLTYVRWARILREFCTPVFWGSQRPSGHIIPHMGFGFYSILGLYTAGTLAESGSLNTYIFNNSALAKMYIALNLWVLEFCLKTTGSAPTIRVFLRERTEKKCKAKCRKGRTIAQRARFNNFVFYVSYSSLTIAAKVRTTYQVKTHNRRQNRLSWAFFSSGR